VTEEINKLEKKFLELI
jgi:hypothetical protein